MPGESTEERTIASRLISLQAVCGSTHKIDFVQEILAKLRFGEPTDESRLRGKRSYNADSLVTGFDNAAELCHRLLRLRLV